MDKKQKVENKIKKNKEKNIKIKIFRQKLHSRIQSINEKIIEGQLRWVGHMYRMSDYSLQKKFLKRHYWKKM